MVFVYGLTLFVSATLLFVIQPLFTRMALPLLGGSPAVWNTAQLFFQLMLLAGYLYAHATIRWLGVRRQAMIHVGLLLLPVLALPIALPSGWSPPSGVSPIPWLLALLAVAVGLPFFVVSISSPMIQAWFAHTRHRAAADPYFLYAASNVGSMLALLGYPTLIEPYIGLRAQGVVWAAGYALLVVLTLVCAVLLWRTPQTASLVQVAPRPAAERLSVRRRARWVLLAFVPSSLMLSVTTYLTTNIAPIPLLWVIPLALYLLTFILVFAGKPILPHALLLRAFPIVLLPLVIVLLVQASQPIALLIVLHLIAFFVITMVCHGELARDRPPAANLTEFYLWLSVGGALGGMFNALVAPLLFTSVLEYPLVLVLACLVLPPAGPAPVSATQPSTRRWLDVALPIALGALAIALMFGVQKFGISSGPVSLGLAFGVPSVVAFSFSRRPLRFGLALAALLLASSFYPSGLGTPLYAERSFFGISRVLLDPGERYIFLAHGTTLHGAQRVDPAHKREPLTYYFRTGPIGQVFKTFEARLAQGNIGVVGLGTGALTCYRQPGQEWTYYEIDPSVVHIARDPTHFTFLSQCAPNLNIVLGDARLSLVDAPDAYYDLLVLDAYSSDAIPIHLLTQEALELYQRKLAPGGVIAFHISNQYLDLKPVIGSLAHHAGLVAYVQDDTAISEEDAVQGKTHSQWAVVARTPNDLLPLIDDKRWRSLDSDNESARWTDDYSSVLGVFKWR